MAVSISFAAAAAAAATSRFGAADEPSHLQASANLSSSVDRLAAVRVFSSPNASIKGRLRPIVHRSRCSAALDHGNGSGGHGDLGGGGGGGNGDGDGGSDGDEGDEAEFGPVVKFEEVMREAQARGASLPSDMLEAAKSYGIRRVLLFRYLDLQVSCPVFGSLRKISYLLVKMLTLCGLLLQRRHLGL